MKNFITNFFLICFHVLWHRDVNISLWRRNIFSTPIGIESRIRLISKSIEEASIEEIRHEKIREMPRESNKFPPTRTFLCILYTYFYLVFVLRSTITADIKVNGKLLPLLRIRVLLPAEPHFYLHNRKIISARNALNDNFEDRGRFPPLVHRTIWNPRSGHQWRR